MMQWIAWLCGSILLGLMFQSTPIFFTTLVLGMVISTLTDGLRQRIRELQDQQDRQHQRLLGTEKLLAQHQKEPTPPALSSSQVQDLAQRITMLERENRELRALVRAIVVQHADVPTVTDAARVSGEKKLLSTDTSSMLIIATPAMSPVIDPVLPDLPSAPDTAPPSIPPVIGPVSPEVSSASGPVLPEISSVPDTVPPDLSSVSSIVFSNLPITPSPSLSSTTEIPKASPLSEPPLSVPQTPAQPSSVSADETKHKAQPPHRSEAWVRVTEKAERTQEYPRSTEPRLMTSPSSPDANENWETFIGSKLLTYLGIGILVLGLVSLLTYSLTQMGPMGRCLTGLGCGIALLLTGFFLEPRSRYTLYGRIVMGGGWSVLYFTAYGAYHIAAMRVIHDPIAGTLALASVAIGMLFHSLRYKSESTTGVALLLSYVTLFVSSVSLYTHVAGLILGVLIGFFAYRWRWVFTHLAGVVLLYAGYGAWLYFQGPKTLTTHHTEYLWASIFLVGLWAIFKAPDFAKSADDSWENYLVPVISLLNLFGLAVVRKITHHVFQTKGAPATALFLGLIYVCLCQVIRWRGRQRIYRLDGTVAVTLILVGLWSMIVPYHTTMLAWMGVGLFVWIYSFFRKDRYFRDLGNLTFAVSTLLVLGGEWPKEIIRWLYKVGSGEMLLEMQHTALPNKIIGSALLLGYSGAIGASLLFAGSWLTFLWLRRQQQPFSLEEESRDRLLVFFATIMMMWSTSKIWSAWPCAISWSVLGFLLFLYGLYRKQFVLRAWSHIVLGWTLASGDLLGLSRLHFGLSMGLAGLLLLLDGYLTLHINKRESLSEQEILLEKFLVVGGSTALVLAASCLFAPFAMLIAWLVLAVVLFFYGYHRGDNTARWYAYFLHLFTAVYAGVLFVQGTDIISIWGTWKSSRYVFVMGLAMLLSYGYAALIHRLLPTGDTEHLLPPDNTSQQGQLEERLMVSIGNVLFVVTGWYGLPSMAVAIAYALAGVLWIELASRWHRTYLRDHASLVLLLSGFWLFTENMNASGLWFHIPLRILSSLPVLLLFGYAGYFWHGAKNQRPQHVHLWEFRFPLLLSFMNFAAVQMLIYHHAHFHGLGWAIHGLVLFVLVPFLQRPTFRICGLIAMIMSGFSWVALAFQTIGDPWSYFLQHKVLAVGPILIFVAHLWTKWFDTPDKNTVSAQESTHELYPVLIHSLRIILGFLFCVVFLSILTILLPAAHFSLGWGIAGFFLGWYGLSGQEKFFRWVSLALFGGVVGKILLVDIFHFSTAQKIITFISVGLALLFISFLYNRCKDKLADLLLK